MKIKSLYTFLLTYIGIGLAQLTFAQNMRVYQLPIMDQLPSNSVLKLFQDKEGYMWFGTQDGFCRYDGYMMKVFRSDLNKPHLLSSNKISSITEDFNDHIWIGTYEGLSILNKKTYEIAPHPDSTLQHKTIYNILNASDSTIWVGYSNGVTRYNPDFSIRENYMNNPRLSHSLPNASVNHIFEDNYQNIWLALWGHGLYKYNKETNTFIKQPRIGVFDNPFKIYQDTHNNYWIGNWDEGLYLFNPNSFSNSPYQKIALAPWKNDIKDNRFFSFVQDENLGYIWAMSMSGVSTYQYDDSGELKNIDTRHMLKKTNNIFSEISKDKEGNLWIGAFSEGVFKIDFNKPLIENFPIHILQNKNNIAPSFTAICEDGHGDIWFNQNRVGLFVYSPKQQNIRYYEEIKELETKSKLKKINLITYIAGQNEIWISNIENGTILCIQKNGKEINNTHELNLDTILKNPGIPSMIYEDKQSNVWIATNKALFAQPAGSKKTILVHKNFPTITSITEDNNNALWISTDKNGIYKMAIPHTLSDSLVAKLSFKHITDKLLNSHLETITADLSGTIWIGKKNGGLIAYNTTSKTMTDRTSDCGLKGEAILDIISDKYNNIWITTYKKVIEFNPQNNASISYSSSDGMQINSHLKNALYKTKDSKYIYIAGNRGYSRFSPSEHLLASPREQKVKITDIKIQNESILTPDKINKYDKSQNTLTLSPTDKNIELYFSALNFSNPNKIRYAYKLDGIDDQWVYVDEGRQFAVYSQLKKGQYNFMVKASDAHNLWGNHITTLQIIREPAIYETNTAFVLYFLLISFVIYALIYIMMGRIKLRNKVKMTEFEKNKTEELTQTKLKYFTNISHDLLTPLTIISCLIDDIETTVSQKIPQFTLMRSNVVRLKRLLQQILDFRRIESGRMKLNITHSDIAAFINDICHNHFLPIFNKKHITFTFSSSKKEINAYFDADKIDKILFNLLSNAFKYTPINGTVQVSLTTILEKEHTFLTIQVSDTGAGIAHNNLDKIFTRFYTNKTLSASDTHGIGLSLSKDLVELHYGTISVDSELNKGTTFTIKIPIDKASYTLEETSAPISMEINENQDAQISNTAEDYDTDNKNSNHLSNITILIVEDNQDLLKLMSQILAKTYHVKTATNGLEALELIKSTDIDIVVSDVMMPKMDGIELCKTIKNNLETSHISIIVLTAKNSINDRIECYNAGADAYISKPFEMKVLQARINNFVSHKQNKQKEFKTNLEINVSSLENHSMDEHFLNQAISIIETHISETTFDINMFASELNLSKSSLYRKIKTITGLSPIEFIRNIKLKHASLMLKNNITSISEVAYEVGFSDPKYFSSCFKNEFNITPSEYQKKHHTNSK